jgi:hypothetical protein
VPVDNFVEKQRGYYYQHESVSTLEEKQQRFEDTPFLRLKEKIIQLNLEKKSDERLQ